MNKFCNVLLILVFGICTKQSAYAGGGFSKLCGGETSDAVALRQNVFVDDSYNFRASILGQRGPCVLRDNFDAICASIVSLAVKNCDPGNLNLFSLHVHTTHPIHREFKYGYNMSWQQIVHGISGFLHAREGAVSLRCEDLSVECFKKIIFKFREPLLRYSAYYLQKISYIIKNEDEFNVQVSAVKDFLTPFGPQSLDNGQETEVFIKDFARYL